MNNSEDSKIPSDLNTRDIELDIVKGFLVIGMVMFHVGTFSIASTQLKHLAVGVLLSFVSGSWVFLTGYVVGVHYGPRYGADRSGVIQRVMSRGLKILLLFLAINTLILLVGFSKSSWSLTLNHVATVFFVGGGNLSSFEILVGISQLLLLAPLFLEVFMRYRVLSFALLLAAGLPGSFGFGYSPNIWMLVCGACGIWIGLAFKGGTSRAARDARKGAVILFAMLVGVVSHFWLFYFGAGRKDIIIYLLGVISVNGVVYLYISHYIIKLTPIGDTLQLLGRYSLFSYIWQMAIIWSLIYTSVYLNIQAMYFRDVLIVLSLLILSILVVDYFRRKLSCFDGLYRKIFA